MTNEVKPTHPSPLTKSTAPTLPTGPTSPISNTAPTEETLNPGCGPEDIPEEHALYNLPTKEQLDKAFSLDVLDKDGTKMNFRGLCQDGGEGIERHLVIFIRHWFCGVSTSLIPTITSRDTIL
jgi:hypothetical protein